MTPNPQNPEILSHPTPGKSGLGLSYQCENYRVVVSGPGAVSSSHDIFWHNSLPSFLAPAGGRGSVKNLGGTIFYIWLNLPSLIGKGLTK